MRMKDIWAQFVGIDNSNFARIYSAYKWINDFVLNLGSFSDAVQALDPIFIIGWCMFVQSS